MKYTFPLSIQQPQITQVITLDEMPIEWMSRIQEAEEEYLGTIHRDNPVAIRRNMRHFYQVLSELPYRGMESYCAYMDEPELVRDFAYLKYVEEAKGEMSLKERVESGILDCNGYSVLLKHSLLGTQDWKIYASENRAGQTTPHTELISEHPLGYLRIDPTRQTYLAKVGRDTHLLCVSELIDQFNLSSIHPS